MKGLESSMEKAVAPHSNTLAWKIPWMDEPGRLESMGLLSVGDDWATSLSLFTFMHQRREWQPSSILAWRIPGTGEPAWLPSVGSHRIRHDWRDLAAAESSNYSKPWFIFLNTFHILWKVGQNPYGVELRQSCNTNYIPRKQDLFWRGSSSVTFGYIILPHTMLESFHLLTLSRCRLYFSPTLVCFLRSCASCTRRILCPCLFLWSRHHGVPEDRTAGVRSGI